MKLRTGSKDEDLIYTCCLIVKQTREHPELESGASVRGAIQLVKILGKREKIALRDWFLAGDSVLRQKVRVTATTTREPAVIIKEIIDRILKEETAKKA